MVSDFQQRTPANGESWINYWGWGASLLRMSKKPVARPMFQEVAKFSLSNHMAELNYI